MKMERFLGGQKIVPNLKDKDKFIFFVLIFLPDFFVLM